MAGDVKGMGRDLIWQEPPPAEAPEAVRELVGGHPLVAKTLVRRGIAQGPNSAAAARAFLDPAAYTPAPASELPDMARAVARLAAAIEREEHICVWGDFDVDGQTSTTLLVEMLRAVGARVSYHIPVRATESHGIKLPFLKPILAEGVDVLLTCDTGISAHEPVAYAQRHGVDVIITDHHELPPTLPDAAAIINPHRLPEDHPLATLPGVGVAYKLTQALYAHLGRPAAATRPYLDLVALGIVVDVAEQVDDTRYLLQKGLEALRHTPRLGLQELMKLAKINDPTQLDTEDIGFRIGPRMNALGRLDDANVIVDFLTTDDLTQARILASELEALNERRKQYCDQVEKAAEAQIAADPSLLGYAALVLSNPAWPPGVIGIVASRLSERYLRPVVLIAAPPDELGRASARSVAGCHITEAIAAQSDLLEHFGGHEMAAGLAIRPENIPAFRRGLSRAVAAQLAGKEIRPTLQIDGYVTLPELSLELVDDLGRLAPFGAGNPPLTLATRDLTVVGHRELGRTGEHLRLTVQDRAEEEQEVVWWRWRGAPLPRGRFDLAYTIRANDYRGRRLQVVWEAARPIESEAEAGVAMGEPAAPTIVDYRREPSPELLLRPLLEKSESEAVGIWREGPESETVPGRDRFDLAEADTLVVWTCPPSGAVLRAVMEAVAPDKIYLFGVLPGLADASSLLKRVAGLVKYALRAEEGRISLERLAAATAHCELTVRHAIAWLEAQGHVRVTRAEGDLLYLSPGGEPAPDRAKRALARLQAALAETAAYRRHFRRATAERLIQ
ncbi:MAG: single-stranded-DNA-specific exonuclease RecJ [Anaerolineales bacterium]